MKRDMDLIRRMLLAQADLPVGELLTELEGVEEAVFAEHVALLIERGLVEGKVIATLSSGPVGAYVSRLTWEGQDFVVQIQDDTAWNTAKSRVIRPGVSWSFDVLKEVLKSIAMKSAGLE